MERNTVHAAIESVLRRARVAHEEAQRVRSKSQRLRAEAVQLRAESLETRRQIRNVLDQLHEQHRK
jgi:hypothetical protein